MDRQRKKRAVLRSRFTKQVTKVEHLFVDEENINEIKIELNLLEEKMENLKVLDKSIYYQLLESDVDENELELEMDNSDEYTRKYLKLAAKLETLAILPEMMKPKTEPLQKTNAPQRFKLPKVELAIFMGKGQTAIHNTMLRNNESRENWLTFKDKLQESWDSEVEKYGQNNVDNKVTALLEESKPEEEIDQLIDCILIDEIESADDELSVEMKGDVKDDMFVHKMKGIGSDEKRVALADEECETELGQSEEKSLEWEVGKQLKKYEPGAFLTKGFALDIDPYPGRIFKEVIKEKDELPKKEGEIIEIINLSEEEDIDDEETLPTLAGLLQDSLCIGSNGTNFVGAVYMFKEVDWEKLSEYCDIRRLNWKFHPPAAPWWGGFWERMSICV